MKKVGNLMENKENYKIKKLLNWIKEYFSWFIAILSLIFSIIGLLNKEGLGNTIVYLVVCINSIVLIGIGIYIVVYYFYHQSKRKEDQKTIIMLENSNENLKKEISNVNKAYRAYTSDTNYIVSTLRVFLFKLYKLTDESFNEIDRIKKEETDMNEHGYTIEEIEEKITTLGKEKNRKICSSLYDDYKRFLSNVLTKTQNSIESYLKSVGSDLEVSITVKQLIEPSGHEADVFDKPYVYTAFRDSKTWMKRIRNEVAQILYTINKNSDFIHCVSQGLYIFNNKTQDSKDYHNENNEFYKYYNSGGTVLIRSNGNENQKEIIYGFLACDVLNTDSSREVIDYNVATILSFSADILASYFDNIGYNWYFLEVSPEYSTFWNMLYEEYLVAI